MRDIIDSFITGKISHESYHQLKRKEFFELDNSLWTTCRKDRAEIDRSDMPINRYTDKDVWTYRKVYKTHVEHTTIESFYKAYEGRDHITIQHFIQNHNGEMHNLSGPAVIWWIYAVNYKLHNSIIMETNQLVYLHQFEILAKDLAHKSYMLKNITITDKIAKASGVPFPWTDKRPLIESEVDSLICHAILRS